MITPVKLPVIWETEDTMKKDDLGIPVSDAEYKQGDMTFYNINALEPNTFDSGKDCTIIHCNGDMFICPLHIDKVEKIIQAHHILFDVIIS